MSALAILSHHRKPLSSMTDDELDAEYAFWSDELSSLDRWGRPTEVAIHAMEEVENEIFRRLVAARRAETIHRKPFIVDDPGVKARSVADLEPIILMGAAKERAEWKPPRIALVIATSVLAFCLATAFAFAGQRLVEIETRYGWEVV